MDKNIAYRKLLNQANTFLEQASHILLRMKLLKVKIRQENIQKDYHEQMLSINSNLPIENLSGYLQEQNSILNNQILYDKKLKELSSLISLVLLYSLQVMNNSIDDSEIDLMTKAETKTLFYKSINFIESNRIEKIIDFSSLLTIIVILDLKIAEGNNTNTKNIESRLKIIKQLITRQE